MGVAYNSKIVTDGLVLCLDAGNPKSYPGSGTTWTDLSGNGNNGTLINMDGTNFNSANGGVLTFDGTNENIEITGNTSNAPSNMSLICWVYTKNTRPEEMIATRDNGSGYRFMTRVYDGGTGIKWGFRLSSASLEYQGTTTLLNNTWYFLAVTSQGSPSNLILYLNGNVELNLLNAAAPLVHGGNLTLGDGIGGAQVHLQANLPIFMMYNRALTAGEIQQNFNATKSRYFS